MCGPAHKIIVESPYPGNIIIFCIHMEPNNIQVKLYPAGPANSLNLICIEPTKYPARNQGKPIYPAGPAHSSNLISSSSAFVKIIPSGIIVNLIELGTSMITCGNQQELKLDPGSYSFDPDGYTFDANVKFKLNFLNLFF